MIHHPRTEYSVVVEKNLPMRTRDGVTLYANVIRPDAPGRFPVLLMRMPYGKDEDENSDPNGHMDPLARFGYIHVVQDCRGRFASEGEYIPAFNDIQDGYDAVEWAARLPWSNGRVGTIGQSYMGLAQYMIACNNPMPPSLQAMSVLSAPADYHQAWVYHTGGAMMLGWIVPYAIQKGRHRLEREGHKDLLKKIDEYVEMIGERTGPLRQKWAHHLPISDWGDMLEEMAPYFKDYIRHPDDGEFWWRANIMRHAESVRVPILHIGSWYDIFLEGAPNAYQSIKERSAFPQARRGQKLIIGPWAHIFPYTRPTSGSTGEIDFGPEALISLNDTQLRWFDYWLKDVENNIMSEPPVAVFTMGENQWKNLLDWPPPNAHYIRWYLHSGGGANSLEGDGTLSTMLPGNEPADTFTYDPGNPVPTLGGNTLIIPAGVYDQRPAEQRQDVLVFTSEPLEKPLEVTGHISVELWAASSACDTDFTAKLVDVHPDGYAQNLQDGIIRARYRDSATKPTLIEPNKAYKYTIDLWATSHVFLRNHRIRIDVSSSNFPRFDRNQNTGAAFGEGSKLEKAKQTVYHQDDMASHIVLPVIPR